MADTQPLSGPQHYREAQALLAQARQICELGVYYREPMDVSAALAHATLALAAATALVHTVPYVGDSGEITEWARIAQPSGLPPSGDFRPATDTHTTPVWMHECGWTEAHLTDDSMPGAARVPITCSRCGDDPDPRSWERLYLRADAFSRRSIVGEAVPR